VIANNLANADTGGFKRALLQVQSDPSIGIYRVQTDPGQSPGTTVPGVSTASFLGYLGTGSNVLDTPTIYDQGALRSTGNPLDVAINGPGFFSIQTAQGVRYTRNGEFLRNAQGNLVTQAGDPVLQQGGGTINIPDGAVSISSTGQISVQPPRPAGAAQPAPIPLAQLALVEFQNLTALRPQGASLFANNGPQPQTATKSTVAQNALETSNADVVRQMVDLIVAQRWFEANEKMIKSQDTMNQESIQQVGHNQ
ncbi:MAG: flagellar hook-basal body protein, partial [Candidatus Eremiobacteraeota bacterium]|nr:flagellar hook-basal body protein [Candidatus Eremiobacteraeota bacterium]